MGRYIDWNDVAGRYPRISERGGANEVGSAYIDYAEVEIEGRLTKFTKPFSSNNLTVKDLAIDLTYAKMMTTRDSEKATEMRDILDARMTRLNSGEEDMMTSSGDILANDVSNVWCETEDYTPVFGMGDVTDFQVDSARLFDEEQDRI